MNFTPEGAQEYLSDLSLLRDYMASTPVDSWNQETVRSSDGSKNCFFGHLFQHGEDLVLAAGGTAERAQKFANWLWEMFEDLWATTYVIYPVNDGTNPKYQQETPRDRCVAYLDALIEKREMTTHESMDHQFALWEASNK